MRRASIIAVKVIWYPNGLLCSYDFAQINVFCFDALENIFSNLVVRFDNIFVAVPCSNKSRASAVNSQKAIKFFIGESFIKLYDSGAQKLYIQRQSRTQTADSIPVSLTTAPAEYRVVVSVM